MKTPRKLLPNEVIRVAIVRTDVFGALAYHAKCIECGWQSIRYTLESRALKLAKAHRCSRPMNTFCFDKKK